MGSRVRMDTKMVTANTRVSKSDVAMWVTTN